MRQESDIWVSKSWLLRHAWNYWGWDQFHIDSCERISGCSLDLVLTGGRVVLFFFSFLRLAPRQQNPYITTNLSQSQWSRTFCVHQSTQSLEFTTEYVTKPTYEKKDLLWLMVSDNPVHQAKKGVIGVMVLGAYGTDSVVDQEVEKARPNWGRGYLSNAFSQQWPSTSFSPPPEGLPATQSSTPSWE